jgi:hypothetical protein
MDFRRNTILEACEGVIHSGCELIAAAAGELIHFDEIGQLRFTVCRGGEMRAISTISPCDQPA